MENIIQQGYSIHQLMNLLCYVVKCGNVNLFKHLTSKMPIQLSDAKILVSLACAHDKCEIIEYLLESFQISVNVELEYMFVYRRYRKKCDSLIEVALECKKIETIKFLMGRGAKITRKYIMSNNFAKNFPGEGWLI